jgi:hypothetical protein
VKTVEVEVEEGQVAEEAIPFVQLLEWLLDPLEWITAETGDPSMDEIWLRGFPSGKTGRVDTVEAEAEAVFSATVVGTGACNVSTAVNTVGRGLLLLQVEMVPGAAAAEEEE